MESEARPGAVSESELYSGTGSLPLGAVSESELYSGTGSLPARREEGAPVRARLRVRGGHARSAHEVRGPPAMAE
jgi:hypothetical protein